MINVRMIKRLQYKTGLVLYKGKSNKCYNLYVTNGSKDAYKELVKQVSVVGNVMMRVDGLNDDTEFNHYYNIIPMNLDLTELLTLQVGLNNWLLGNPNQQAIDDDIEYKILTQSMRG